MKKMYVLPGQPLVKKRVQDTRRNYKTQNEIPFLCSIFSEVYKDSLCFLRSFLSISRPHFLIISSGCRLTSLKTSQLLPQIEVLVGRKLKPWRLSQELMTQRTNFRLECVFSPSTTTPLVFWSWRLCFAGATIMVIVCLMFVVCGLRILFCLWRLLNWLNARE